ncbi:DMT family transporter [Hydrogenophaga soli]
MKIMRVKSFQDSMAFNVALLLVLSLLWGCSYGLIALGLREFPFVTLMALRSLVACLALFAIFSITRVRVNHSVELWRMLFWQSLVGNTIPMLLVAWAQKSVPSAMATIFGSTIPLFIFLMALFEGEKISIKTCVGAVFGFLGVVLATGDGIGAFTWENILPYAALLLSSLSYAVAAIYAKNLARVPSLFAAAGSMLWASLVLLTMSVLFEDWRLARFTLNSMSTVLILGVFCTGVGFWILFKVRNSLGSMAASSQVYLRLPVGIAFGVFFLDEKVGLMVILGSFLVALGVIVILSPADWYARVKKMGFRRI